MKKTITAAYLVTSLFATSFVQAQSKNSKEMPFLGVNAGYNFSKLTGSPDPGSSTMQGFGGGIFLNVPVTSKFSVEPAVEYSDKGADYNFGSTRIKEHLGYIDVPVKAKYNLFGGLNIFAAPQMSFVVDKYIRLGNDTKLTNNALVRASDPETFRDMVLGAKGGLNYNFGSIGIVASYSMDLQGIYKDGSGNPELKNRVINAGVCYNFKY